MNTTSCSEQGCGVAVAERQRYYARQVMIRFINSGKPIVCKAAPAKGWQAIQFRNPKEHS